MTGLVRRYLFTTIWSVGILLAVTAIAVTDWSPPDGPREQSSPTATVTAPPRIETELVIPPPVTVTASPPTTPSLGTSPPVTPTDTPPPTPEPQPSPTPLSPSLTASLTPSPAKATPTPHNRPKDATVRCLRQQRNGEWILVPCHTGEGRSAGTGAAVVLVIAFGAAWWLWMRKPHHPPRHRRSP